MTNVPDFSHLGHLVVLVHDRKIGIVRMKRLVGRLHRTTGPSVRGMKGCKVHGHFGLVIPRTTMHIIRTSRYRLIATIHSVV